LSLVYLGVESGDDEVLRSINKGVSAADVVRALPVAAVPPLFTWVSGRVMATVKTGENLLNLTKSKRSRIGFKAGLNGRKG
jgi:hypothetical protein